MHGGGGAFPCLCHFFNIPIGYISTMVSKSENRIFLIEICGSCDGVREKELSAAKNYETAPAHVVHSRTIFEIVRLYQPSGEIQSTFQTRMSDNW